MKKIKFDINNLPAETVEVIAFTTTGVAQTGRFVYSDTRMKYVFRTTVADYVELGDIESYITIQSLLELPTIDVQKMKVTELTLDEARAALLRGEKIYHQNFYQTFRYIYLNDVNICFGSNGKVWIPINEFVTGGNVRPHDGYYIYTESEN